MLVCATLFWAGNFTIGKFAFLENIPPNTLAFLRWCLVWIILLPFTYREIFKLNNKIRNLRKVTTAENNKNKSKYKNNSTGYPGIYLTYEGKFRATAYIDGKSVNAGTWETIEDAVKARNDLRGKIHG